MANIQKFTKADVYRSARAILDAGLSVQECIITSEGIRWKFSLPGDPPVSISSTGLRNWSEKVWDEG